jgi:hypothetical protein
MDDVRVGGGFIWETTRAKIYLDEEGRANLSISKGPWGSILKDDWQHQFLEELGGLLGLFASLGYWISSGNDASSPVLERLRYANSLISEAYCEPHDRIRLVRMVAALEALAVLSREKKSESLAWRCAYAGGWQDCSSAVQIVDDILQAYTIRNAIVHGDGSPDEEVASAFHRLERNLHRIYVGFLDFHAKVQQRYKPTHIRHLRRAFDLHIEDYFWEPEEIW